MKNMYQIAMVFAVTRRDKAFSDFMKQDGGADPYSPLLSFTQEVVIKETLPFVPDEAYLGKVKDILVKGLSTDGYEVSDCEFKGYKYFIDLTGRKCA